VAPAPARPVRLTLWRMPPRTSRSNDGRHSFLDGAVELPAWRSVERHFLNHLPKAIFNARQFGQGHFKAFSSFAPSILPALGSPKPVNLDLGDCQSARFCVCRVKENGSL
jgi:hypothetical protein